jgi:hypothetical protein
MRLSNGVQADHRERRGCKDAAINRGKAKPAGRDRDVTGLHNDSCLMKRAPPLAMLARMCRVSNHDFRVADQVPPA